MAFKPHPLDFIKFCLHLLLLKMSHRIILLAMLIKKELRLNYLFIKNATNTESPIHFFRYISSTYQTYKFAINLDIIQIIEYIVKDVQ